MNTLQLEKTPASFRRKARLARKGLLVLTVKGKPAYAVVEIDDELALEALALSRDAKLMAYLDKIRSRAGKSGTYSLAQMRREANARPRQRPSISSRRKRRRGS
jgi:DNA polymerase III delta prime subunit